MRELSLFTGAGGGLLGTHLLGWRPVGYVEFNEYCQRVIRARIDDGILPSAPIFTDVREFIESGCAQQYRGFADVVTAGFPCQPFSVAGKRAGADDERNMWPATIECLRLVRPKYALLENVPGLLTSGYFGTVLGDLAAAGYNTRWCVLSAADCGAPHRRDRLWIVAHAGSARSRNNSRQTNNEGRREADPHESTPIRQVYGTKGASWINSGGEVMANADGERWNGRPRPQWATGRAQSENSGQGISDTNHKGLAQRESLTSDNGKEFTPTQRGDWWATEPALGRVAHGVASRVDRLKAIGNGQVATVAATAWRLLNGETQP